MWRPEGRLVAVVDEGVMCGGVCRFAVTTCVPGVGRRVDYGKE